MIINKTKKISEFPQISNFDSIHTTAYLMIAYNNGAGYDGNAKISYQDFLKNIDASSIKETIGTPSSDKSDTGLLKTGFTDTGNGWGVQVDENGMAYIVSPWSRISTDESDDDKTHLKVIGKGATEVTKEDNSIIVNTDITYIDSESINTLLDVTF